MAKYHVLVDPYDARSVDAAIKAVEAIRKGFDRKVELLLEALAEIGREAASGAFGSAVTVTTEPIPNGFKISANGDAVVFLEFGAGWGTDGAARYASKMPFDVSMGSYSRDPSCHKDGSVGEFYYTGYDHWTFGKREYTEIPPRHGMQKAYEAITQQIRQKVQEIFK